MTLVNPSEKLILALDGMDVLEALSFIDKVPDLIWVKVGLELFATSGLEIFTELRARGKKVFLDLKFHDIPNTMAGACYRAARNGAELITVHACAGSKALLVANEAAKKGAASVGLPSPTLLGVTVLTSWTSYEFGDELDIHHSLEKRVEHLAQLAFKAGLGGCICSPCEVKRLREIFPESFELITPGIRFLDSGLDDQARVMQPRDAFTSGASRLVLGRIITRSTNPAEAFTRVCRDIQTD
ncbi:orotidine-5'-phosphate decarboxylase [Prochlorococcus marinus]|uniref:Orotidine 5'-phosphate decarboxylase n=1 Tax=Prochlorococcus marinus (strain MIT 9211) TaxID=93059 RepID=PYRF_PROM4|nr:orotidine-5'-phosphate decarboxylase [Prochlorococcus marinus]A9BBV1.1 RecName: Full=Orotidine 5'-phosphate decarboxylase; AltName: Full=OMP decarboxylase; Short=OMPDCase; Short=OMPdecase [Prochlorococcus marinus str. MIT 9211]ABX09313.1 orotidine 5'-phosphate decarboxylase [Prochlorococcus marinus str. MIT 9211]